MPKRILLFLALLFAIARAEHLQVSDPVSVMSSSGGLLTLYSTKKWQWVWGYTPLDSQTFGDARVWRILTRPDGKIYIQNEMTKTCLTTFGAGVIHSPCNFSDSTQIWNINTFDNQAIQLRNEATRTCLQTPTIRTTTYYSIYTVKCSNSTQPNLDQQWYITAPARPAEHIILPTREER